MRQIQERRRCPRFRFDRIQIWKDLSSNILSCKAKNLSAAGVCIVLDEELEIATRVGVKIMLLDRHHPIACNGKINWTMARADKRKYPPYQYDTGIEFVDIRKSDVDRIVNFTKKMIWKIK